MAREQSSTAFVDWTKKIDKALTTNAPPQGWWFNVKSVDNETVVRLMTTYKNKGWDVDLVHDERDGTALVLREP